jgi:3-oxoacyl-[acyl-carrier-protein] synthase-1
LNTYLVSDNIISPLGITSKENFAALVEMRSGVRKIEAGVLSPEAVCAAKIDDAVVLKNNDLKEYTRLEKLLILSVADALSDSGIDITSKDTLIIFSSTKGNIDLLDKNQKGTFDKSRLLLWKTAQVIADHFKNPNKPLVVSNACISGVVALITGKRLLGSGRYKNIIVCGADILTPFVVSGFQSFKAVSPEICKPYDAKRDGISMGEAAATIILTNDSSLLTNNSLPITITGGASSNDANHISGPSRDGNGLYIAIRKTLEEAGLKAAEIDHICGHGTATVFNDDMESMAINSAGLQHVPMNSLKSYFGHTLGAAGIVESIIAIHSMQEGKMIGTFNHTEAGTVKPVNILKTTTEGKITHCLKTAAGFGGCNAAILFSKQ